MNNESLWKDYANFRKMVTPLIIGVIFWIGVIACVLGAIGIMYTGYVGSAILILIFSILGVRIWCEMLIIIFKIYEVLEDIKKVISEKNVQ